MPTLHVYLTDAEAEALRGLTPSDLTPQQLIRAVIYKLDLHHHRKSEERLLHELLSYARQDKRVSSPHAPGQRKGHDSDDYRRAWQEHGTVSGVARELSVNRKTASEMLDLLGLR